MKPLAPALAHDLASSLTVSSSEDIKGLTLLKMAPFFQIRHVVSIINEEIPLRMDQGVDRTTSAHHSTKSPSANRGTGSGSDPRQNTMPQHHGEGAPSQDMLHRLLRLIAERAPGRDWETQGWSQDFSIWEGEV
jgi:hypothetical protein